MADDSGGTVDHQREQMLRLVAKAFYRELANYGVATNEVLSVANHLLDNVVRDDPKSAEAAQTHHAQLTIDNIRDEWSSRQSISLDNVGLHPLQHAQLEQVADWLADPLVQASFAPVLPAERQQIIEYFVDDCRDYFAITHDDAFVGIVGAENIDTVHLKLEMKKLIGVKAMRGKGIGTRATFAFLYHAFMVRGMHKVYVHSPDTNVRNLNLNSRLGFELEGIFLEEFKGVTRHIDVVRMALLKPIWLAFFSG